MTEQDKKNSQIIMDKVFNDFIQAFPEGDLFKKQMTEPFMNCVKAGMFFAISWGKENEQWVLEQFDTEDEKIAKGLVR